LDRWAATVPIHPTTPEARVLTGIPGPIEDYPADTTRAALDMVVAGHMARFTSLRVILAHGGGFLPYAASRFAELNASVAAERPAETLLQDMQRFYFDAPLVGPSGMPSLLAFAQPGRILFGTDYPYASEAVSRKFTRHLDQYPHLPPGKQVEINTGARALFQQLRV